MPPGSAVFLPGKLALLGTRPLWESLRQHAGARAAMPGINAAVVGLPVAALYNPVWTSSVKTPLHFGLALIWEWVHAAAAFSGGLSMAAFNVVRFRVKPGRDQEFLDAHKRISADWRGLKRVNMIKIGDQSYCIIGEWADMDALANARPQMIATLDTFRHLLDDLGGGLGVTDPVSGPVVLELK